MLRPLSIRFQLLALAFAAVAPLLAAIVVGVYNVSNETLESARREIARVAAGSAVDVEKFTRNLELSLATLAKRPRVSALDPAQCDPVLREIELVFPALSFPDSSNVGIRDVLGNSICSVIPDPPPAEAVRRSPAFQEGLRAGGFHLTNALRSPVTRRWISIASYPIRKADGSLGGLLFLRLDLRDLQKQVLAAVPASSVAAVFDRDAHYLMRTLDPDRWIGRKVGNAESIKVRAKNRFTGFDTLRGSDGIVRVYAFSPVGNSGWLVGAGIPEDVILAPYYSRLWRGIGVGLVVLLLATLLALRISAAIASPVHALARAARAVAGGETAVRAPVSGPAEITTVAAEFNRMLDARAAAEQRELRLANFYAALAQTNQAIVRMHDPQSLYGEICRICVEYGHAKMAFVGLVADTRVVPVAWAGPAGEFLEGIELPLDDPHRRGPIATAIASGHHSIIDDYHADPATLPWRERGAKLGTRSVAAFPFRRSGKVAGALSLHVAEHAFFDERLVGLLREMVEDLSFGLDNFDRIQAQAEARRQELAAHESFRKVFHAAPMAMSVSRFADGRLVDVNQAYCSLLGHPEHEIVGRTVDELGFWVDPERRALVVEQLRSVGGVREFELRFRTRSGQVLDLLLNAERIEFMNERRVLAILSNITERKHAADLVRDLNVILEKRVAERTAELEAANRDLEGFGRTIAHDLRTPVRAIVGFTQALRESLQGALDPVRQDYLFRVERSAARMDTMLADMLSFARSGRAPLNKVKVDMHALAASVIEDLANDAPRRPAFALGELPPASGDPSLLRQVWVNLISNAIKFSSKAEHPRVEIGAESIDTGIRYFVRDNGCGYDPVFSAKLFQPFERLHSQSEFEGNGVGLAIVQRIVERHGGSVSAQSEPGKGATFGFSLPA